MSGGRACGTLGRSERGASLHNPRGTGWRRRAAMTAVGQSAPGWTVVLRRRPARIVAGQPEGGYTSLFEIICCYCGDDPDLDYREVSPELRRIRGPYQVAAGVAAYWR